MARVKTLNKQDGAFVGIDNYPNFSASGSVKGMKNMYYGKDALLVKCGGYIYNVSASPEIYMMAF